MKHLKYFENSEDGRKEIWEIDDQVSHLINNDNYILIMLKKIGMDDNSVKHFINYQLSGIKREMEKCKEYNREFYLYIEKVYNTSYTIQIFPNMFFCIFFYYYKTHHYIFLFLF